MYFINFTLILLPLQVYYVSKNDRLPVGLIAQWVEQCVGIVEVMGSNPIQASIFFRLLLATALGVRTQLRGSFTYSVFHPQSKCLIFICFTFTMGNCLVSFTIKTLFIVLS